MTTVAIAIEAPLTFEQLFLREYPLVVGVARRVVGDLAAAEDVAQEAFAAFARRMRPDDPQARAWLCRSAVNAALNDVRARKRRLQREYRDYELAQAVHAVLSAESDPQRMLDRREIQSLVRAAMIRLPERVATILALRYGGLSYREIAVVMGIAQAQVGTYLARAQRAFRKEIEDVDAC